MNDASPPAERSRPAWYLLGLAALVVAAAAVFLYAPELPRRAMRMQLAAPPLGDAPMAVGDVGGELAVREPRPALPGVGRRTAPGPAVPEVATTPRPDAPALPPPDDARAVASLAEAEQRYAAMDWDGAASVAGRIGGLACRPAVAERAAGIARGAVALKRLFAALDHRDDLQRNWDTHPALLSLDDDGRPELLVPLAAPDDPLTAVAGDPLAWTEDVRRSGAPGWFLLKTGSSFNKAHIVPRPGRLTRVDQQSQAVRLGQQLDRMLVRIDGDPDMRDDPNAWYEAGKFAYRNRLDSRVTALLDRAFRLDPDLASTIREGNAGSLSGAMIGHIRNGSRQQAASFMRIIDERYADTRQGRLARLYYDGRTAELLAAARPPVPAAPADAPPAAPVAMAAPADLARARQLFADGSKPYHQANGMPATDERNRLYHQASAILRQAKAAYALWCEAHPDDAAAAAEAFEAGRMEVAARKYATL